MLKILKQKKHNDIIPKTEKITAFCQAHFLSFRRLNPIYRKTKKGIKITKNKYNCPISIIINETILPPITNQTAIFVFIGKEGF